MSSTGCKHSIPEIALVIGADDALRRLTATILRQQGFAIQMASSLEDGEDRLLNAGGTISLLIANAGAEEARAVLGRLIRCRQSASGLRIIVTSTSRTQNEDLEAMDRAGVVFLSLPYSFARFSQAVASSAYPRSRTCGSAPLPYPSPRHGLARPAAAR